MALFFNFLTSLLVGLGILFCLIGAFGILKLPDVFSRMHSAGIIDTIGITLIFFGLIIQSGFTMISVKLILILVFIFFSSPTSTHALAKAALNGGVLPKVKETDISLPIDKFKTNT